MIEIEQLSKAYGDKWALYELNMRVGKVLRFGRSSANVGVDFYNLLNAATPLSYNQAFIPNGAWLTPTSVLSARFMKLSMQLDF